MTAAAPTADGVLVRGTCKAGHVTETRAAKGRVTAQVTCAHEGCGQKVNCRRIRQAAPQPPPDDAGGTRVLRIDDYDATASGAPDDPGGLIVADDLPPEPPAGDTGVPSAPAGSAPAADDPIDDDEPGGLRARLAKRRRAAAVRSARRDWRNPLL